MSTRPISSALLLLISFVMLNCDGNNNPIHPPDAILVDPAGTGDQPTIQAAIDVAESGAVIELADGTFVGNGNHNLSIRGKSITIRSISGDPANCIINCGGDHLNGGRGFAIYNSGSMSNTTVIEGLTISEGVYLNGAGILCDSASVALNNCDFVNNTAYASGSAISCSYSCLSIDNCKFIGNNALMHGAGTLDIYRSNSVSIDSCHWSGNIAHSGASGISCFESNIVQTASEFINNVNYANYGVLLFQRSNVVINGSTVANNSSSCRYSSLSCMSSSIMLEYCTISQNGNETTSASVFCSSSSDMKIENTIIAFAMAGHAVECQDDVNINLSCCDTFGHPGGDWTGAISTHENLMGNISIDPQFIDLDNGVLSLSPLSPCGPDSSDCGVMGAWPVHESNP